MFFFLLRLRFFFDQIFFSRWVLCVFQWRYSVKKKSSFFFWKLVSFLWIFILLLEILFSELNENDYQKMASATALRGPTPNCKSCLLRLEKLSSFFLERNFFLDEFFLFFNWDFSFKKLSSFFLELIFFSGWILFVFQLGFSFKKLSSFFLELNFFLDEFLLFFNWDFLSKN